MQRCLELPGRSAPARRAFQVALSAPVINESVDSLKGRHRTPLKRADHCTRTTVRLAHVNTSLAG
jgi:hypothetical protein